MQKIEIGLVKSGTLPVAQCQRVSGFAVRRQLFHYIEPQNVSIFRPPGVENYGCAVQIRRRIYDVALSPTDHKFHSI